MAEKTALQKLQTTAVTGVVVLLCAVFVLQFGGPQAEGCTSGGAVSAGEVYGQVISAGEHRAALRLADDYLSNPAERARLSRVLLDGLVERDLLVAEAAELGLHVDEGAVWEGIAETGAAQITLAIDAPGHLISKPWQIDQPLGPAARLIIPVKNRDGEFDTEAAKRFVQYGLGRSVAEFAASQVAELMADRMRQVVMGSVSVSPREVWDGFVREKERAKVQYIRFSRSHYADALEPTADELRAWMAANAEAVDRAYQAARHRYTGVEKQVRARHILIKVGEEASEADKAAARTRAAGVLAEARRGASFPALAREHSEDAGSARRGGDLGWNPRGRMVAPFDEAQFSLPVGQISELVETQFGFHIIKVEGTREGDVPEADAKLELAEELYRERRAEELAADAARTALAELRAGTTFEEVDARLAGRPAPSAAGADAEADASADEEPDPSVPQSQESRPFGRTDSPIAGLSSGALARAAFELTTESPFPTEPLRLGSDFVVFKLLERSEAARADFTEGEQRRLEMGLLRVKQTEALKTYVHALRQRAEAEGAIRLHEEALEGLEETPPPSE